MSWARKKRDAVFEFETTDEIENISMYVKYLRIKFVLKIRALVSINVRQDLTTAKMCKSR